MTPRPLERTSFAVSSAPARLPRYATTTSYALVGVADRLDHDHTHVVAEPLTVPGVEVQQPLNASGPASPGPRATSDASDANCGTSGAGRQDSVCGATSRLPRPLEWTSTSRAIPPAPQCIRIRYSTGRSRHRLPRCPPAAMPAPGLPVGAAARRSSNPPELCPLFATDHQRHGNHERSMKSAATSQTDHSLKQSFRWTGRILRRENPQTPGC